MKQPPDNWEDIKEFEDRCTCDEYEWEEHNCPFSEEILDDPEDYCTCCPYCAQECSYNI
jgi:hypothetical protein